MRYSGLIVIVIALAACGATVSVGGDRLRSVAETPSGKRVAIYRSSAFTSEARDVPEEVVVQAMRASSMFFEEDIRALSPKVAPELGKLGHDERLVVSTNDTAIYMFVATGELQIVAVRDGLEVSRHASPIPTAAVKTELTPRAHPVPDRACRRGRASGADHSGGAAARRTAARAAATPARATAPTSARDCDATSDLVTDAHVKTTTKPADRPVVARPVVARPVVARPVVARPVVARPAPRLTEAEIRPSSTSSIACARRT